MGIRGFFRRRRERESALPPGALEAALAVERGSPQPGARADADAGEPASTAEFPGADPAEFAEMLRKAASTGLPQVSVERHEVDLRGTALGDELVQILAAFGIERDASPPAPDGSEAERLNEQIREALRREGIDPDSGLPGSR